MYCTSILHFHFQTISPEEVLCPGPFRDAVIKCLLLELDQQCRALCQKKAFCSILRGLQPSELTAFSFEHLVDEWRLIAPLLLQFLTTVASVSRSADCIIPRNVLPGLCTAGAVLLRLRNVHMSALHHLIGLILFHGNSSKLVCHCFITYFDHFHCNSTVNLLFPSI